MDWLNSGLVDVTVCTRISFMQIDPVQETPAYFLHLLDTDTYESNSQNNPNLSEFVPSVVSKSWQKSEVYPIPKRKSIVQL